MSWANWIPGRLGTGYRKLPLARGARWDLYLLDFPPGAYAPPHVDRLEGRRHVRVNLRLWGADTFHEIPWGAERVAAMLRGRRAFGFFLGPLAVFRADFTHAVTPSARRRVVLSLGLSVPGSP